jgi:hypothetical protein
VTGQTEGTVPPADNKIHADLIDAQAALRRHMASWEYAFAMGSSCHGATAHPQLRNVRAKTERLRRRCHDLEALLAEYRLG